MKLWDETVTQTLCQFPDVSSDDLSTVIPFLEIVYSVLNERICIYHSTNITKT